MSADLVEVILATIRQLESGGHYLAGPNAAKASGAYQYIPSTWRNEGGYPHAYLAPPDVQDARARADVERFLAMYGGDASMVPVMWYYPRAASDPKWMDRVPNPAGGNRLTIREYQTRWMELLARRTRDLLSATPVPGSLAEASVLTEFPEPPNIGELEHHRVGMTAAATRPAVVAEADDVVSAPFTLDALTVSERTVEYAIRSTPPEVIEERGAGSLRSIVFPVLGPVVYSNGWGDPRDGGTRRHEGTDIIGVTMQPLLAATDGEITQLRLEPRGRSGVALSIRDADGWRYNYFHANNDTPASDDGRAADGFRLAPGLELGGRVIAGQIIGYLGDSGNAEDSVPHLHFEFRDPQGRAAPSFWSLKAAEARQACTIGIGPWSTPVLTPEVDRNTVEQPGAATTDGVWWAHAVRRLGVVRHTVVTPMYGEGQWVIDSDGRVTATGDAALVMPSRSLECAPGPATPFGTDAGGWARFDHEALAGTVLDGADLTGTVLDGQVGETAVPEVDDPPLDPMVFNDPASGERIIVILKPPPLEPTRQLANADRAARRSAMPGRRSTLTRI